MINYRDNSNLPPGCRACDIPGNEIDLCEDEQECYAQSRIAEIDASIREYEGRIHMLKVERSLALAWMVEHGIPVY